MLCILVSGNQMLKCFFHIVKHWSIPLAHGMAQTNKQQQSVSSDNIHTVNEHQDKKQGVQSSL